MANPSRTAVPAFLKSAFFNFGTLATGFFFFGFAFFFFFFFTSFFSATWVCAGAALQNHTAL